MNGIWCLLLLGRWSMVLGWRDWFRKRFHRQQEFVSIDARRFSNNAPRAYEMLQSPDQAGTKSPERVSTPDPRPAAAATTTTTTAKELTSRPTWSPTEPGRESDDRSTAPPNAVPTGKEEVGHDYVFGRAVTYTSPHLSFSSPRPPQSASSSPSPPPSFQPLQQPPPIASSPPRREWDPIATYARPGFHRI